MKNIEISELKYLLDDTILAMRSGDMFKTSINLRSMQEIIDPLYIKKLEEMEKERNGKSKNE